jgi:hypothetical protein
VGNLTVRNFLYATLVPKSGHDNTKHGGPSRAANGEVTTTGTEFARNASIETTNNESFIIGVTHSKMGWK